MGTSAGTRVSIPPSFLSDDPEWKRAVGRWMLEANQGHLANTGNVTLTANVASTSVVDARAGANSFIGFTPTTLNAATEATGTTLGAGTMWIKARGKQVFTIKHTNNAQTDRTFVYCILG